MFQRTRHFDLGRQRVRHRSRVDVWSARRRLTTGIAEDWQKEGYEPPSGEPDPGGWLVHIALDPSDRDAVRQAAPQVVPAEQVQVHTDVAEDGDGDALLALQVYASTSDEATERADEVYRRIRQAAGLPAAPALVLGFISPWWRSRRQADLGKEALQLNTQGRHELAVIRIQTVCELWIVDAFTALLRDQHPEADASRLIRRPATLRDDYSKAFLEMLTGRRIQDEAWWPRYVDHLKRRNAIVHEGLVVDRESAIASIEASFELRRWLLDVRGAEQVDDADQEQ